MPISTLCQTTLQTLPFRGTNPQSHCIYWDAELPSFGLRVYASSRRTFVCTYREDGRKRLVRVGRTDVLTLIEARERAAPRALLRALCVWGFGLPRYSPFAASSSSSSSHEVHAQTPPPAGSVIGNALHLHRSKWRRIDFPVR